MRQRIRKAGLRAALLAPAAVLSLLLMGARGPAAAAQPDWPFVHDLWSHSQARGRIGVAVQAMTPELREFMKAPADRGVLVTRVEPERPAAKADLRVGDVIVAAAGDSMEKPFDLVRAVAGVPSASRRRSRSTKARSTRSPRTRSGGASRTACCSASSATGTGARWSATRGWRTRR